MVTAKAAGRGALTIAVAKAYFVVSSYAVHLVLPRLLSAEDFGRYSIVVSFASIVNNVLIAATVQTVSKLVSERHGFTWKGVRQLVLRHGTLGTALGLLFTCGATLWASTVLRDDSLVPLLRWVGLLVWSYSMYAVMVGTVNGSMAFGVQARLDMTFSTLRTALVLGLAAWMAAYGIREHRGALGAVMGFSIAALLILGVSVFVVRGLRRRHNGALVDASTVEPPEDGFSGVGFGAWQGLFVPLALYQLALNGLLLSDVLVFKSGWTQQLLERGLRSNLAAQQASEYAAYYAAGQKFAFVPYQLMLSLTFVVFPMISRATRSGDEAVARNTLRAAFRISLLLLAGVASVLAGAAEGVMGLAYPDAYVAGAGVLRVLAFSAAGLAVFVLCATALSGAGHARSAAVMAGVGLGVLVFGVRFMLWGAENGQEALLRTALGSMAGVATALGASLLAVHLRFGALPTWKTTARMLLAGTTAYWTAVLLPTGHPLHTLGTMALATFTYLGVLVVTRELGQEDLTRVRGLFRKRS